MQSPNQHIVATDISDGKNTGRYRDCQHLHIYKESNAHGTFFRTACHAKSLVAIDFEGNRVGACPRDCQFFLDRQQVLAEKEAHNLGLRRESEQQERSQRWKAKRHKAWTAALAVLKWFDSKPWQTQVAIIGFLLFIFGRKYIPELLQFLRALAGK